MFDLSMDKVLLILVIIFATCTSITFSTSIVWLMYTIFSTSTGTSITFSTSTVWLMYTIFSISTGTHLIDGSGVVIAGVCVVVGGQPAGGSGQYWSQVDETSSRPV